MIPVILFALALFLAKGSLSTGVSPTKFDKAAPVGDDPLSTYPNRFREDHNDRSFAGRTQMNVRLPFGPNPQQKTIQEMKFFDSREYQNKYRMNLNQVWIKNQDWRLDPTINGPENFSAGQMHLPEDNLDRISKFGNTHSCFDPFENKKY